VSSPQWTLLMVSTFMPFDRVMVAAVLTSIHVDIIVVDLHNSSGCLVTRANEDEVRSRTEVVCGIPPHPGTCHRKIPHSD
jgi:hypothetical protein